MCKWFPLVHESRGCLQPWICACHWACLDVHSCSFKSPDTSRSSASIRYRRHQKRPRSQHLSSVFGRATQWSAALCYEPVCLSVCLSVTLVSHAKTVQDIEIYITPYSRGMFLVHRDQISHPEYRRSPPNKCIKHGRLPVEGENWTNKKSRKRCKRFFFYNYSHIGSDVRAFHWYQNRWPWVTLNGAMAVILRNFTEIETFVGNLRHNGWS